MIKNNIVLVLGAGTSLPYGFPLAGDLRDFVIKSLLGDGNSNSGNFVNTMLNLGYKSDLQHEFATKLHDSHQPSIDLFLQQRNDNKLLGLGKAAIAAALIPYEQFEGLKKLGYELVDYQKNERWYGYLLDMMGPYESFLENNLSIITFNYDRSLEYFMFHTLKTRFNIDDIKAIELLNSLNVTHVYGQLGVPDFLLSNNETDVFSSTTYRRGYSPTLTLHDVKVCMNTMNLMYEESKADDEMVIDLKIQKTLRRAKTVIFLGFGYHEKNIEKLNLKENFDGGDIYATSYGKEDGEVKRIIELIEKHKSFNTAVHNAKRLTVMKVLRETNYLT